MVTAGNSLYMGRYHMHGCQPAVKEKSENFFWMCWNCQAHSWLTTALSSLVTGYLKNFSYSLTPQTIKWKSICHAQIQCVKYFTM